MKLLYEPVAVRRIYEYPLPYRVAADPGHAIGTRSEKVVRGCAKSKYPSIQTPFGMTASAGLEGHHI